MMVLTGSRDESIIVVLADNSEVEISVLEKDKVQVLICANEGVDILRVTPYGNKPLLLKPF